MPDSIDADLTAWLDALGADTRAAYVGHLDALAKRLGHISARTLVRRAVAAPDALRAQLASYTATSELAANTLRAHVGTLERALLALHRRGHLAPSFAELVPQRDADLDAPAAPAELVDLVLDQLERDRADSAPRTLAAVHLTLRGLRPGEIVELRRRDVHLEHGRVVVGGDQVELGADARLALADWLRARGPGAMVFPITTRQLQRDVARAADAVGGQLSLVELRRRAIADVFERDGIHAAARFARVKNAGDLRRIVGSSPG